MNPPSGICEPRAIVLYGIPFHDLTMAETLDRIDRLIADRRASYLVTANLDFAAQASEDVELQRILVEAEIVLCDGTPLVWASRLTGNPLRERVAGSDLVPRLAAHAEKMGYRIFLLGGEPSILKQASENLQRSYPSLPPVRYYSPPFAPLHEFDNSKIVDEIQRAGTDILLVAFGCPKQEKWIYMHYRQLQVPCCIGVGATVDFLAGKVFRAPAWVARFGLEWVYRMLQEPRRLAGRYFQDFTFLVRQSWRESRAMGGVIPAPPLSAAPTFDEGEVLRWAGPLIAGREGQFSAPSLKSPFVIDLSGVTAVDRQGLGILLSVIRHAWAAEVAGCFLAPSPAVLQAVEVMRLDRILPFVSDMEAARLLIASESLRSRPEVEKAEECLSFKLPSRLSAEMAGNYGQAVRVEWEKRPELRELVFDLSETKFLDSSGLGLLIRSHRMACQREGGRLRLLNLHDNVRNVIQVAKLEQVLL